MTEIERPMVRTALISPDGQYRYILTRHWRTSPAVTWIMLNPSTADGTEDDPTIRRCMSFARRWGYGGIRVVNLYALRATNPNELRAHPAPDGPDNRAAISEACFRAAQSGAPVVAAWGAWWESQHITRRPPRLNVEGIAAWAGVTLQCLGTTKNGSPRHPLYVRGDTPPEPFVNNLTQGGRP